MKSYARIGLVALSYTLLGACIAVDQVNDDSNFGNGEFNLIKKRFAIIIGAAQYGPYLEEEGGGDYLISIDYVNDDVRRVFFNSIDNEIIGRNVGKKIICDCEGHFRVGSEGRVFVLHRSNVIFENP